MTFWDYLSFFTAMLVGSFLFIAWLGTKYDVVGRDERNKELQTELIKMQQKEARRKARKRKKEKGGKS